jgi:SDR family mycofactocin-dependent oxidoreductase
VSTIYDEKSASVEGREAVSMGKLEGKVALITGAARGQGRSHAVHLASEGADIIAVDFCQTMFGVGYESATPDDLATTRAEVEKLGGRIVAIQGDVRDLHQMESAVQEGLAMFDRLDIVVANAGVCTMNRLWEITPEQWNDTIATNLTGVWHTLRASIPSIIEGGRGGSIIITSSTGGTKGLPFLGHYVASKHAVVGLMRTLANELAEYSIRVNTIHPTSVDTPMGHDPEMERFIELFPSLGAIVRSGNALPVQQVESVDISQAVLWLSGPESRYVTGATIAIDAGFCVK